MNRINARSLLKFYVGSTINTYTGKPNKVMDIDGDYVLVGTSKTPTGNKVEIDAVQEAIDQLLQRGEVEVNPQSLGYRSSFIGAVLLSLPGVIAKSSPFRAVVADRASLEPLSAAPS